MNKATVEEITALVARIVKVPEDKLDPKADLFTSYGVDSLSGVEIFAALDKKYQLNLPESKLKNVRSVEDLTNLVNSA